MTAVGIPSVNPEALTSVPAGGGGAAMGSPGPGFHLEDQLTVAPLPINPDSLTGLPAADVKTPRLPSLNTPRTPSLKTPRTPTSRPGTDETTGPLLPGTTLGSRYHIIRLLGMGGMGAVYQAWDAELGVAVAIKVILPDVNADPQALAELEHRFKRGSLLLNLAGCYLMAIVFSAFAIPAWFPIPREMPRLSWKRVRAAP